MAVLITGAGFIGCHTAKLLLERGERVIMLDSSPEPEAIGGIVGADRVTLVRQDICNYEALLVLIDRHRIKRIFHAAAVLSRGLLRSPREGIMVNVMGTANVLEAARECKLERVVLASSTLAGLSVVENFKGERFPEDFSMRVVSEHPRSLYAVTKISAEHLCLYYRHAYEVDVAAVRYSAVIGDWQGAPRSLTGQILSAFLDPAMQGRRVVIDDPQLVWSGSQEYVDVRDAARGTIAALHAPAVPSAVYNISSGVKHTFEEFIGLVREVYPAVEVDIRVVPKGAAPAQARPPLDLRLAAQELGFKPLFQMRDTIKDYVSSHA
jgi:UDP-glucose 4-epimerase